MQRITEHQLLSEITARFANRAFLKKDVPEDTLEALVEAAGLAPSCFNEQPWRFLLARGERRQHLLACLTPQNQEWAARAPVLVLTCAQTHFSQGGQPNPWHLSDAGCAAGFFMLEAQRRGLIAHPMAGFSKQQAREAFSIPEELALVHVMAVGWPGDLHLLSPKNQARNIPGSRRPYQQLLL